MAGTGGGISGLAVAVATGGAILVYAGIRGVNPAQALRDIASGNPPPVTATPTVLTSSGTGASISGASLGGAVSADRGRVVAAAQTFSGDTYSQARRRQTGYSDCSSFVDKALRAAGISPPTDPWATTGMYRLSPQWRTISLAQSLPGDVAVSGSHMVLITGAGGTSAIGQQRTGVNVRTGSVANLMTNTGRYVVRTYRGYAGSTKGLSA